jgi:hypothetical protein
MRTTPPEEPFAPPLGPWRELGVAPADWADVPCAARNDDGCVKYLGPVSGTGSADAARRAMKKHLQSAGYRIDMEGCRTMKGGAQACHVTASKFRAVGSKQQVTVVGLLRSSAAAPNTFTGSVGAVAEHAFISYPSPQPKPASPVPSGAVGAGGGE